MKNYYSILGVTPDSSEAEIKSAYRRLARKFHPDVNPDGASRFKDIARLMKHFLMQKNVFDMTQ